jgi:hypothetical protein
MLVFLGLKEEEDVSITAAVPFRNNLKRAESG